MSELKLPQSPLAISRQSTSGQGPTMQNPLGGILLPTPSVRSSELNLVRPSDVLRLPVNPAAPDADLCAMCLDATGSADLCADVCDGW